MRPSFITQTRSATRRTTFRSWLISSSASPRAAFSRARRSRMPAWIVTSSAVVGSSAISSFGLFASAMAIITRCRCPPLSWCGKAASRDSASGKPTRRSSSATAPRAGLRPCSAIASATWRPTLCSGFRLVIGSWNTIPAVPPRTASSAPGGASSMDRPSSVTAPVQPAPGGSSCRIDNAVSDLPDPLSPTSARVSPRSSVKLTPSTTRRGPNATDRSRTSSIRAACAGQRRRALPRR